MIGHCSSQGECACESDAAVAGRSKATALAEADAAFARKYPLHVELKSREAERQAVANFLDWLDEHDLTICGQASNGDYYPDYADKARRIGEFLEIDPQDLDAEKCAMLAELREVAS